MKKYSVLLTLTAFMAVMLLGACSSHEPSRDGMEPPSRGDHQGPPPDGQHGQMGPMSVKDRVAMLAEKLKLTPEQAAAVEPILQEQDDRRKEILGDDAEPGKMPKPEEMDEETRKKMEDLDWDISVKLSKVMTKDQLYQYTKLVEQESKDRESHGKDGRMGPPPGGGRPGGQSPF